MKELVIKGDNGINNNPIQPINKDVIKNPQAEIDKNLEIKYDKKKNILISGSNYQNIVPNIGVRIQEEDKTKTGGIDFKNQFGRMSMKEYELLRQKYAKNYESNPNKNNYNYDNHNNYNNYENIYNIQNKRSETYDSNNHYKNSNINLEQDSNSQMVNNISHNNQINNNGLKYYDWGSEEKVMPDIINYNINLRNIHKSNINSDNNGNKVLNENLFKRNTKKNHSVYGKYYSDKGLNYKINKEKTGKDINYFNNQIMQNKHWGSINNSSQIGRINFNNSIKKGEGINMRTRKKL